ncbi:hypothetical protein H0H93_002379 [Arthromyces matolae]|nr:hypothetical protein H0H93_002379 [Arthromyces matolae]
MSVFNIVRASIYGIVLLFTVICLAMAGHFQHVLAASDLSESKSTFNNCPVLNVPLQLVFLGLAFLLKERNPINTRTELACLGLVGIFWLGKHASVRNIILLLSSKYSVLGLFLVTSDSQSADVECYSSATSTQPLADSAASFHTEQYHAMYRVLMTFSLMNAVLVLLFCLGLLVLALRKHRSGETHMWYGPVTSCAWFNRYDSGAVKRGNSKSSSILPLATSGAATSSGSRKRSRGRSQGRSPYASGRPSGRSDTYEKPLPKSPPVRQLSGNSGRSGHSTIIGSYASNDFERGNMLNPNMPSPARHSIHAFTTNLDDFAVLLLSGAVLGLAANFASLFLPTLHRDFTTFALIVPSVTILLFLLSLQWAQPRTEALMLFVVATLWIAMGAWSADIIGPVQCDGLAGQRTATKNGGMSAQAFCYEMKVVEAFSWMIFSINTLALIILFRLVTLAQMFGRFEIWREPIRELPWFGEVPGFYNTHQQPMLPYPGYGYYNQPPMSATSAPHPGQTIVIQPGMNGQPATVTTVPMA